MDYRYFPDPDLLPLEVTPQWIAEVKATMPELPDVRCARYINEYSLTATQARMLTESREFSEYYEKVIEETRVIFSDENLAKFFAGSTADAPRNRAQVVLNWMLGEMAGALNRNETNIGSSPIDSVGLAKLIYRSLDGTLNNKMAKEVFAAMWAGEGDADAIIEKRGLKQISDSGEIEKVVDEVLAANAKSVEEFRAGKEKAFNALVGQVMKATRGKANPAQVNELLKKKLGG
jgi:aspartyl-tRNA(Asn)/glutamyl-tRNA(Gln) amidotransferase subunit B